jgi:hypothetical protein
MLQDSKIATNTIQSREAVRFVMIFSCGEGLMIRALVCPEQNKQPHHIPGPGRMAIRRFNNTPIEFLEENHAHV